MDTIRDLIQRLSNITATTNNTEISEHVRRLILPNSAQFTLDGTILRTRPRPDVSIKRPGSPIEVEQLLWWLDRASNDEESTIRGNDIGTDLAAILAFSTGRKVEFANEEPIKLPEGNRYWFLEEGPSMDGELYGPVEGDIRTSIDTVIRAIVALPEGQAISLGAAIRMRNAACCLVESDYSSAYGLLVAALETLSQAFGQPPTSWDDWDQAKSWDEFIQELSLDSLGATKLRNRLIADKHIRLKRTFTQYVLDNLDETFWQQAYVAHVPMYEMKGSEVFPKGFGQPQVKSIAAFVPNSRTELRKCIGASYDARSTVFHRSSRLSYVTIMPLPRTSTQPLPFNGLRRVLDYLIWREVNSGADGAPSLPTDLKVYHEKQ